MSKTNPIVQAILAVVTASPHPLIMSEVSAGVMASHPEAVAGGKGGRANVTARIRATIQRVLRSQLLATVEPQTDSGRPQRFYFDPSTISPAEATVAARDRLVGALASKKARALQGRAINATGDELAAYKEAEARAWSAAGETEKANAAVRAMSKAIFGGAP
jgi:hypothetical protein